MCRVTGINRQIPNGIARIVQFKRRGTKPHTLYNSVGVRNVKIRVDHREFNSCRRSTRGKRAAQRCSLSRMGERKIFKKTPTFIVNTIDTSHGLTLGITVFHSIGVPNPLILVTVMSPTRMISEQAKHNFEFFFVLEK